jgi:hypothetical protein
MEECKCCCCEKGSCWGFGFFLYSPKRNMKKKTHNMVSMILHPRFKNIHLVSLLIDNELGKTIVEEFDRKSLYPMLLEIIIYILRLNLKVTLLTKELMKISTWIFLK